MNEIFPERYVHKGFKFVTGANEIPDLEKYLLAPAVGIESAVASVIGIFNPQNYKDLYDAIYISTGMSYKEWCLAVQQLKVLSTQLKTSDIISNSISFVFSAAFLFGGISSFQKLIKGMRVPLAAKKLMGGSKGTQLTADVLTSRAMATGLMTGKSIAQYGPKLGQALPGMVLGGLHLKYVNLNEL